MAISAIGEIPALLNTRYERLPDYKELEFVKAKSYYKTRKYTKAMGIFDSLAKSPGNLSKRDLLYWRASVYDRLDKNELAISTYLEIFENYPKSDLADDSLYLAARCCEEVKDYDRAIGYYKKYLDTFSHGKMVEEIIWYTGWLYYKTGDYGSADGYFTRLAESYKGKEKYPQYLYWRARSLEKRIMIEDAVSIYKTILDEYSATYYGYQAEERLEVLGFDIEPKTKGGKFDPNFWTRGRIRYTEFTSDDRIISHLERSMELVAMDMDGDANRELDLVVGRCVGDPDLLIEVARLLRYSGDYHTPIVIANRNFKPYLDQYLPGENDLYWQMKYPEGYKKEVEKLSSEYDIDTALIYSLIRAESMFQPGVYSWAGAIGLMQIIPDTGRGIAKDLGISDFEVDDLLDYKTNLAFGVYYLSGLLEKFDGEMVYALCAYNAGPGNAKKWLNAKDPDTDMDEFIENIPYPETRQYIKRILEYYSIYRALYEG
jgi:soluble lytic murein transglycosylase